VGHHQQGHPLGVVASTTTGSTRSAANSSAGAAAPGVVLQEQVQVEHPAGLEREHGPHGYPDEHVRSGVQQARQHHAVERRPEHDDGVVQQRALGRHDG